MNVFKQQPYLLINKKLEAVKNCILTFKVKSPRRPDVGLSASELLEGTICSYALRDLNMQSVVQMLSPYFN